MPTQVPHRGPDPRDREQFAPEQLERLRRAVEELSWLESRGYAEFTSLKLVGDRHGLQSRQRMAVRRSACGDRFLARRAAQRVPPSAASGEPLWLDGFNVLTTVEAALGGAVVLRGRDGCDRDVVGLHGSYRQVAETVPALRLVGEFLALHGIGPSTWLLDRPVSNSGRLREVILGLAAERGWDWSAELPFNPDAVLASSPGLVATSDREILDAGPRWLNLARQVIEASIPSAWVVDLEARPRGE